MDVDDGIAQYLEDQPIRLGSEVGMEYGGGLLPSKRIMRTLAIH